MSDIIFDKLINNIKETNKHKSSHWTEYLKEDSNYLSEFSQLGFGSFTKRNFFIDIIRYLLMLIIFGNKIFKTDTYQKYKFAFNKIDRFVDTDTIRHVYVFEKIKKILNPKTICIIGDGKLNGVLGANLTFPKATIFSVNLSETLINDYLVIKKLNTNLAESIALVDEVDFKITDKLLYLVPANFKNFLINKKIDLFINIGSFQEMTVNEVNAYFKIISNNKSKLYCCNREYKKLFGGEELIFDKYPWSNSKNIFWEDCPWHKKYYIKKFPFIVKYAGNMKHCLVDFS